MTTVGLMVGCKGPLHHNLPPAQQLMEPGPGVGGPGPGVMACPPQGPMVGAAGIQGIGMYGRTSQIFFAGPEGMSVQWDVSDAPGQFGSEPLICPGRYNFPQGAIYRLKLTNIVGREGMELYPTLEVAPVTAKTEAFLAHNPIPVQFSAEDFDQVRTGNFVTKVIYLPDKEYQQLALSGVETLVSTRLDPGDDPVVEADRRGAILAIVRLGNIDLQIPGEMVLGGAEGAGFEQDMYGGVAPGGPMPSGPMTIPSNLVAGVTAPAYGMPYSGTPIGLPGPMHVPYGVPAGLKRHTMVNHTHVNIPDPTSRVRIDMRQTPGMSYPKPANHAFISEQNRPGLSGVMPRPLADRNHVISSGPSCPATASAGGCPTCP